MQENDKTEFAQIMTIISETYDKPVTTSTMEIYFEILRPFTIRQIKWALKKILMDWSYHLIPPPAEFVKRLDVYRMKALGEYVYPEYLRQELKALGDPIPRIKSCDWATPYEEAERKRLERQEFNNKLDYEYPQLPESGKNDKLPTSPE